MTYATLVVGADLLMVTMLSPSVLPDSGVEGQDVRRHASARSGVDFAVPAHEKMMAEAMQPFEQEIHFSKFVWFLFSTNYPCDVQSDVL